MFASTSSHMLRRLSRKCDGGHSHQHLIGGRAAAAAFYPPQLGEQILRRIRDTADEDARRADQQVPLPDEDVDQAQLVHALRRAEGIHDVTTSLPAKRQEQYIQQKLVDATIPFHVRDGSVIELEPKWKDVYNDECK